MTVQYTITKSGSNIIATPTTGSGLSTITNSSLYTVLNGVNTNLLTKPITENKIIYFTPYNSPYSPYITDLPVNLTLSNLTLDSNPTNKATIKSTYTDPTSDNGSTNICIGVEGSTSKIGDNVIVQNLVWDTSYLEYKDTVGFAGHTGGLRSSAVDNLTVKNCTFKNTGTVATCKINVWTESQYRTTNINVHDCQFINSNLSFGGIKSGSVYDCIWDGHTWDEFTSLGLSIGEYDNSLLENFEIYNNLFKNISYYQGIVRGRHRNIVTGLQRIRGLNFHDNIFRDITTDYGITPSAFSNSGNLIRDHIIINNNKFERCGSSTRNIRLIEMVKKSATDPINNITIKNNTVCQLIGTGSTFVNCDAPIKDVSNNIIIPGICTIYTCTIPTFNFEAR